MLCIRNGAMYREDWCGMVTRQRTLESVTLVWTEGKRVVGCSKAAREDPRKRGKRRHLGEVK